VAQRAAGLVLILDGCLVALLGITALVVFQPIAAIEGRPPIDQTPYPLLIVPLLLGLAYAWAGQRAVRGIRRGRGVGIVLAAILAAVFGALAAGSVGSGGGLTELSVTAAIAVVQVLVILAIARWPDAADPAAGVRHA
jgi:hypothetical protein